MLARAAVLFFSHGFLFGWIWSSWTLYKASAVLCTCKNITKCEKEICNFTEESNHFSCFGRRTDSIPSITEYQCDWKIVQYSTYTLYIEQKKCRSRPLQNQSMISQPFSLSDGNMTAYAFAVSEDEKRCTFAKFTGSPSQMIHCGPPKNVSLMRRQGYLNVTAEWGDNHVKQYYLKYREHNTTLWKEVTSKNKSYCSVQNLTSFLTYEMQIQCVITKECPQCPLSEIINVPQEFVNAPIIKEINDGLIQPGQRKVIVEWEYVQSKAVESYNLTVQKESGEFAVVSSYNLHIPAVTLILSYSAYNISINAFNRAGSSPSAHKYIKAMDNQITLDRAFRVYVNSSNSFKLCWSEMFSEKYNCYSVEWWESGKKSSYQPFFERKSCHEINTLNVHFQPYRRYHFFLHARPDKETCNLKKVNDSELTFGRAQAYFKEGAPLAPPGNIRISNVTQSSFVIIWSPVVEERLRGFLQGYIIRYVSATDNNENNITVNATVNSYELVNLQSQSVYRVQLSAYTAAGDGTRSDFHQTKTHSAAIGGMLAGVIVGVIALLLAFHLSCRLLQRSKNLLWPSIPNPCNSNAVQKIEGGQELEMLKPLYRQNREETEEHVCVLEVKKETSCSSEHLLFRHNCINNTFIPIMAAEENETLQSSASPSINDFTSTMDFTIDSNRNDSTLATPIDNTLDSTDNNMVDTSNSRETECVSTATAKPAMVFVNDYTTMELFQQITKAGAHNPSSQTGSSGTTALNPGQDYIHQALIYADDSQQERGFQR